MIKGQDTISDTCPFLLVYNLLFIKEFIKVCKCFYSIPRQIKQAIKTKPQTIMDTAKSKV